MLFGNICNSFVNLYNCRRREKNFLVPFYHFRAKKEPAKRRDKFKYSKIQVHQRVGLLYPCLTIINVTISSPLKRIYLLVYPPHRYIFYNRSLRQVCNVKHRFGNILGHKLIARFADTARALEACACR